MPSELEILLSTREIVSYYAVRDSLVYVIIPLLMAKGLFLDEYANLKA